MKIFRFAKKVFFIGLTILSSLTNTNSLSCISMNNEECKARPQVINAKEDEPVFIHLVLKQVNVVLVVIILTMHMQKFVFLIL